MPSRNTYCLTWVSLTWDVGYLFTAASSKAQPLFLTLNEGYLLTAASPDLEHGVAPLGPPAPAQQPLLGGGVAPLGRGPWPSRWCSSSPQSPLTSGRGEALLGRPPVLLQPGALGCYPRLWARSSPSWPHFCVVRRSHLVVRDLLVNSGTQVC